MMEIGQRIFLEVIALCGGLFLNFSPYWNATLFANATQKQAESDGDMPLDLRARQRYVTRKLVRASLLFYVVGGFFLIRDAIALLRMLLG